MLTSDGEVFHSFYAGKLQKLHFTSMRSYVAFGHGFKFWTYDQIKAPCGIEVCDASEIVPVELYELWMGLSHRRKFQNFSNYFRYLLIAKKGGWWVDVDSVCIKKHCFEEDYVFSTIDAPIWPELKGIVKNGNIPNGVFKAPKNAPFLLELVDSLEPDFLTGTSNDFGQWGAIAFSKSIYGNNVQQYQEKGGSTFIPFSPRESVKMFIPNQELPDAHAVHFFESFYPKIISGEEEAGENSIYSQLIKKFCPKIT